MNARAKSRTGEHPVTSLVVIKLNNGHSPFLDTRDIVIAVGKPTLLFGPNGSGKTTVIDILSGYRRAQCAIIEIETGTSKRTVRIRSSEQMFGLGVRRTWQHARLIDALSLDQHISLAHAVAVHGLSVLRMSRVETIPITDADKMLATRLGIAHCLERPTATLSLSEQKRGALMLAMRSGNGPLLLDEPFAGLDSENSARLLDVLRDIPKERPLLVVEHERHAMLFANWEARTYKVENGGVAPIRLPTSTDRAEDPCSAFRTLTGAAQSYTQVDLENNASVRIYRFSSSPAQGDLHLVLKDRYGKALVDLKTDGSTLALLVAPNGWGKSSLLRRAVGLTGNVMSSLCVVDQGSEVRSARHAHLAGVRLTTAGDTPFPELTVEELIALQNADIDTKLAQLPSRTGTALLSGGERTTLSTLVSLRSRGARIALLDEPLLGTDRQRADTILENLRSFLADAPRICLVALPGTVTP